MLDQWLWLVLDIRAHASPVFFAAARALGAAAGLSADAWFGFGLAAPAGADGLDLGVFAAVGLRTLLGGAPTVAALTTSGLATPAALFGEPLLDEAGLAGAAGLTGATGFAVAAGFATVAVFETAAADDAEADVADAAAIDDVAVDEAAAATVCAGAGSAGSEPGAGAEGSFCATVGLSRIARLISERISSPACFSGFSASRNSRAGLSLRASLTVFRTSSSSASFKASSNWLRNSPAMDLSFVIDRPNVRKTRGKSFGPTTRISTIAMTRISPQPRSNIELNAPRAEL
ncbi:membrane hypothetical protein [Rhizobium sp. EC-SD404]|nr:membrane hypothetical protein [Rhizobium sp. EC-SD404]